jgi:hypothetical protein
MLPPMGGDPDFMTEGPMEGMIDPNEGMEPEEGPTLPGQKVMDREAPDPSQARRALVDSLQKMVKSGKTHWDKIFKQMERDQKFCAGHQWNEETKGLAFNDDMDDRYTANITLRHVQQKVAALYSKNPKAVARRRPRLLSTVWDGTQQSLQQAHATLQAAQQAQQAMQMMQMSAMTGAPMPGQAPMAPPKPGEPMMPQPLPAPPPPMPDPMEMQNAQAVIQDSQQVKLMSQQQEKIARTLELLYEYELNEQQQPFKSMMKMTIRRAATSGVGWIKLGFQRIMGKDPDFDTRIADVQQRLSTLERISADLADGEIREDMAEAEQLRLLMEDMQKDADLVVREGLQLSYPRSTAVIPDPRCVQLRDFLGCDWVAEEYLLSTNEVKETYGVDVGSQYTAYDRVDVGTDYERARAVWQRGGATDDASISEGDSKCAIVWEIYNKKDGLVYVICDGYPDFLRDPAQPDVYTDRFWPWFSVLLNETDGYVYPLSDVALMRPMQKELNRARQGLREHRFANRPKMGYAEGLLSEEDLDSLKNHPVNALISISGLQPGQDIKQVLQPIQGAPLDPNLYEVNPIFQDMMRSVGDQEANLGGTAEATATETNIAQASRASAMGSAIDDIDETLTAMARAAGQILLLNVSEETVKEIIGPGAVWPTLTKGEVAKEIILDIEAGSSGRPNQQQELQNFERLAPILMQIPGINPVMMAKEAIKRLDDRINVDEMIADGAPSITSMNAMKPAMPGSAPGPGAQDPNAQGPAGASNAPAPPSPHPSAPAPKPPNPMNVPGV